MNILLLMMAGTGSRFGADIPKQFVEVENRPVFSYILEAYDSCDVIDRIVAVTGEGWTDYVQEWSDRLGVKKLAGITRGGDTRSESVKNGLTFAASFAGRDDVVMLHDATHPYVDESGTEQIVEAVREYGGATLGQFQYDTVYRMDEETHMLECVVPCKQIV